MIGLGESGKAAALLLKKKEEEVGVTEISEDTDIIERAKSLEKEGVGIEIGNHTKDFFKDASLVVVSPGVPPESKSLNWAKELRIPVISEIEMAYRYSPSRKIIAVSGTNGKTTVVTLLEKIFQKAGKKVVLCGNIGKPFSSTLEEVDEETDILMEVSSFQLERIVHFRPSCAILLNVSADHLDRYPDIESYLAAKSRLFLNQKGNDISIVNSEDPRMNSILPKISSPLFFFGRRKKGTGVIIEGGWLISNLNGKEEPFFNLNEAKLSGAHNEMNLAAVLLCSLLHNIKKEVINKVFRDFSTLPHRLELICKKKGVRYIDDSKATNVSSTKAALSTFPEKKVILFLGGKDKGGSYLPLKKLIEERVKFLLLVGEAKERIKDEVLSNSGVRFKEVDSLEEGVRIASSLAKKGDIVLLSPACSSFDMFRNYKERGDVFKRAVSDLP